MVALGLKGNFISRLFPKNVCVERHNSSWPTAWKISTFGLKAERNDRKELKQQVLMNRDPIIPVIDCWLPVIDVFNSPWNHLVCFEVSDGTFWCPFTSLSTWIVWCCPKIEKYEVCPGHWHISLLCSLVYVMEQLSRAISYLERCQSYFLTSSICAIAIENSLLRSVFSTKHISAKFFWKFWRQKLTSHSRSVNRNEQRSTFRCTSWPLFLSLGQNKLIH